MGYKHKRRLFPVINRSLQYRYLLYILIYCFLLTLILAVFLFIPDFIVLHDETRDLRFQAIAADNILTLHTRLWPAVILLITIICLHSFRVFHRIVGPLFRFSWAFKKIGSGDFGFRVKIRRGDLLHKEQNDINKMMDLVSENLKKIQDAGAAASMHTKNLKTYMDINDKDAMNNYISLEENLDKLESAIKYFNLTRP